MSYDCANKFDSLVLLSISNIINNHFIFLFPPLTPQNSSIFFPALLWSLQLKLLNILAGCLEFDIILQIEDSLEKSLHFLLVNRAITISINQLVYLINLLITHQSHGLQHKFNIVLYFVLVQGAILIKIENNPYFFYFGENSDLFREIWLLFPLNWLAIEKPEILTSFLVSDNFIH